MLDWLHWLHSYAEKMFESLLKCLIKFRVTTLHDKLGYLISREETIRRRSTFSLDKKQVV